MAKKYKQDLYVPVEPFKEIKETESLLTKLYAAETGEVVPFRIRIGETTIVAAEVIYNRETKLITASESTFEWNEYEQYYCLLHETGHAFSKKNSRPLLETNVINTLGVAAHRLLKKYIDYSIVYQLHDESIANLFGMQLTKHLPKELAEAIIGSSVEEAISTIGELDEDSTCFLNQILSERSYECLCTFALLHKYKSCTRAIKIANNYSVCEFAKDILSMPLVREPRKHLKEVCGQLGHTTPSFENLPQSLCKDFFKTLDYVAKTEYDSLLNEIERVRVSKRWQAAEAFLMGNFDNIKLLGPEVLYSQAIEEECRSRRTDSITAPFTAKFQKYTTTVPETALKIYEAIITLFPKSEQACCAERRLVNAQKQN